MAFTRPKAAQIDFDITNITDPLIRLNSGQSGANDNDVIYVCDWGAGDGTGTIIEAGLFNIAACTSGMCAYDESMNIVKGAADTLQITWTITFGAS